MKTCHSLAQCVAWVLAIAACGPGEDQQRLDAAQRRWRGAGITSYRWVVQQEISGTVSDPIQVDVVGKVVTGATRLSADGTEVALAPTDFEDWFAVAGLFAKVQSAIDHDVHLLVVDYDPQYGYPARITIDASDDFVDDTASWDAYDLQPQP